MPLALSNSNSNSQALRNSIALSNSANPFTAFFFYVELTKKATYACFCGFRRHYVSHSFVYTSIVDFFFGCWIITKTIGVHIEMKEKHTNKKKGIHE